MVSETSGDDWSALGRASGHAGIGDGYAARRGFLTDTNATATAASVACAAVFAGLPQRWTMARCVAIAVANPMGAQYALLVLLHRTILFRASAPVTSTLSLACMYINIYNYTVKYSITYFEYVS